MIRADLGAKEAVNALAKAMATGDERRRSQIVTILQQQVSRSGNQAVRDGAAAILAGILDDPKLRGRAIDGLSSLGANSGPHVGKLRAIDPGKDARLKAEIDAS